MVIRSSMNLNTQAHNQREEVFLAHFGNWKKSVLILGKNAQITVIYGLNFSSKMQFLKVSWRKNRRFFPAVPFFFVLQMIIYRSALIPRKLPCPKKFLVTRLHITKLFELIEYFLSYNYLQIAIHNSIIKINEE